MAGRARGWVFTLNNPAGSGPELLEQLRATGARYCVFQHERGESGTPHFQGYIYYNGARALSGMKKILPLAHWEQQKGSAQQATDYCTKQDTRIGGPWTFGDLPTQGAHITDAATALRQGKTMREVAQDYSAVFI